MKEALILAAGRGARLDRPGTPKPLIEVGGRPIIVRLIEQLGQAGVEKVHVVVGYRHRCMERALSTCFWEDLEVVIHENPNWREGMSSSLLAARRSIGGRFLLAMGDHVFDDALVRQMAGVDPGEGTVVAMVDGRSEFPGSLETALKVRRDSGHIADLGLSILEPDAVDAGLFACTGALFEAVEEGAQGADLVGGLKVLADREALAWEEISSGEWNDVDTPVDLVRTEGRLRSKSRVECIVADVEPAEIRGASEYDYVTGDSKPVRMVVRRGVVSGSGAIDAVPRESASSPVFVFTDETVGRLYGNGFARRLGAHGFDVQCMTLPDGEDSKTLANYQYLVERVLGRGVDERSVFISVGGGVVCNVCGFVASTIYRGLDLVHVPTSLMAQCDAAISHKQAINGHRGKNMVGTYYNPRMVLVDVEALVTLTDRQVRDGFAEIVKHGLGQDEGLATALESHRGAIRDLDFLEEVITRNIELKCILAKTDPKENREGMVLQYGHTVGHPIEHLSGYSLFHGESVAMGMMVAARVARILGACDDALVEQHASLLEKYGLPTLIPASIRTDDVLEALKYNKKYLTEGTRMALLTNTGKLWSVDDNYAIPVSDQTLAEAIDATRT